MRIFDLLLLPLVFLAGVFFAAGCDGDREPPANRIMTEGVEATVLYGDNVLGTTPCNIAFPAAGTELVRLEAEGYEPVWCWLKPPPEEGIRECRVTMQPVAAPVFIDSIPAGAAVVLDGENTGKYTPVVLMAAYGEHSVRLKKHDGVPLDIPFAVRTARPIKIEGQVSDKLGQLRVITLPEGASVFLDGEMIGTSNYSGLQSVGSYDLRLVMPGFSEYTSKVNIIRDEETVIGPVDLKNLPGQLIVSSDPEGAMVFIDGKEYGIAPLEAALVPGRYKIVLRKNGFAEYAEELYVQSNKTARVDAVMANLFGSVKFSIIPEGVHVSFNGQYLGQSGSEPFVVTELAAGRYIVELMHPDIIPAETPARYTIDIAQGQDLVFPEPVSPPLADVELVLENNSKPWKGRIVSEPDSGSGTLEFLSIDGGTVVLPVDKIREIRPLNNNR